jgi:hypothetical protein
MEPDDNGGLRDIVRSPRGSLARADEKLVRRGLDELSRLLDSRWWLVERERPLVLLVDYDSTIDETIKQILTANGYEVRSSSSREAVELARRLHPHVAILRQWVGMESRTEVSKYSEIVLCATEENEIPVEPFAIFYLPIDKEKVLDAISSCVFKSEKKRRQIASAFSRSADSKEFLTRMASVVAAEILRSELHGNECSVISLNTGENWQEQRGDLLLRGMRDLPGSLNELMESSCRPHVLFHDPNFDENYFTILLSQTTKAVVDAFASKLDSLIRGTDWKQLIGSSVSLTAAISAASFPQDGSSAGELLERIWFGTGRSISSNQ